MKEIRHYMLPLLTEKLYEKEAISSIALTKEIASKINELVGAYNTLHTERLAKYQEQDGKINKAILYMKDNLENTLYDMFEIIKNSGDFDTIIKDVVEPSILSLTNKTDGVISVASYGAVGDGIHDDTLAIQKAIDEAYETNKNVILPSGTFKITSPLKLYDGQSLIGNGAGNTVIKRTGVDGFSAAIMFCLGKDATYDYTQGQKVTDLSITCEDYITYGIYSETSCPYSIIDKVNVNYARNGIYLKNGAWVSKISNVVISDCETGIYFGNTGTSTIFENIYVTNASNVGYDFNGLTYSQLKNLACDWCKGVAYKFNFCFVIVDGLGCESKEATTAIYTNNSHIIVNSPFIFALKNTTSKYIYGNGGWLKVVGGSFGSNGESKAKFVEAGTNFNLEVSGVNLNDIKAESIDYSENNVINLDTGKGSYSISPFEHYTFIGKHNTDMMKGESIGYDYPAPCIYGNNLTHPYFGKGVTDNREWNKIKNCGDIFINNAPQSNGVAMYMQISDTDLHKSSGVITSISGNDVYVSSMDIGITAEKRGVEISTSGSLYNETKQWSESSAVTAVDKANNKITVENASYLSVGDHFYYKSHLTYMRDADYGYVQLTMSGNSGKRPASPRTGMMYLDTQINKPIWWNGNNWIDATGATV